MGLLPMVVVVAIFVPVEVWAEEGGQWNELRVWKEVKDDKIPVLILRDAKVSENQVDVVEDAINSKDVKNSRTQFLGWNEGIKEISKSFGVKVPTLQVQYKLDYKEAITIYLMDKTSNQGYDGYTNLFYDENGKIKKAFVKIYNVDELSKRQLESIIRHELGHALGLGHTDAKNDLMQSIINMNHNLISLLDLQALARIY
ncbi:MAG: M57 family metalloprotease [Nitrosopumilus sp.]